MDMDNCLQSIKSFLVMLGAFIASAISPIEGALFILGLSVTVNILYGIRADKVVNEKNFSLKKAWEAIQQMLLFWMLIFVIHSTGSRFEDEALNKIGVKWLTYVAVYFYIVNILKNAKQLHPSNKAVEFLYDVLTTDIFIRLQEMIGIKKIKKHDEQKDSEESEDSNQIKNQQK